MGPPFSPQKQTNFFFCFLKIKHEPNVTPTQQLQVTDTNSDEEEDSYSDDESPKKRRDLLTRRPSYRKILNDLGGGEIAGMFNA